MISSRSYSNIKLLFSGAAIGTLYGVTVRFIYGLRHINGFLAVMSVDFLLVMQFVGGFLSVYFVERRQKQSVAVWLLVPWLTVLGGSVAMILALLEGWICIIMYLPVGVILS